MSREAVVQLLNAFGEIWPDSHWGPLHILIEDKNVLDCDLEFCREAIAKAWWEDSTIEKHKELKASSLLLDMLALIPEDQRDIHAEAFVDE